MFACVRNVSRFHRCAEKMSGLADQCESSPSLMALAMVPNIGSFVSFVCAQAAALVEKWVLMLRPVNALCRRAYTIFSDTSITRQHCSREDLL